ncbi:MAG: DUF4184 family protein [Planctomycetaceae bacterium]|nr:DUF4184 family protein [Planctomycetaceae bacterium]MCA9021484.1 DUF4184 family protein [Planctomycetaceae bacterium]
MYATKETDSLTFHQGEIRIPLTPFHFCPGLLTKVFGPRAFWLTSFMAANVLIDLEVLYYLSRNETPLHRHLHSYLGGSAVGLVAGLIMWGVVLIIARLMPASSRWKTRLDQTPKTKLLTQSLLAGLIGGISHVFLDSLMHDDMHPFWPFVTGNTLAGIVSVSALHIGLGLLGLFSLLLWLLLREP